MATIRIPVNELNKFDLPKVCAMTGATDATVEFRKVKFSWFPRWVYLLLLFNLLVMAIVARVTTKEAEGELALSEAAWKRWQLWKALRVLGALAFLAAIGCGMFGLAAEESVPAVVGLVLAVAAFVVVVAAGRAGPVVVSLKDNVLILKVPSDESAALYERHLHAS